MTSKFNHGTVLPIQYLRGLAAVMVVYHHIKVQIPAFRDYLPGSFGSAGVDIFFVISGFIRYMTTANSTIRPGEFMMRRIIRVVPLYWLLTSLMCLTWLVAPRLFNTLIVTPSTVVQSMLFIPHYSLTFPDRIFPLLVPGWTLNFEMFFYAVFALTLLIPKKFISIAVFFFMLSLVSVGFVYGPFDSAMATTYTSPLLLEFVSGVLLAKIWMAYRQGLGFMTGIAVFSLGWIFLIYNSVYSIGKFFDIAGATLIVAGTLNAGFLHWKNNGLKVLGDATYAIYLSHIFTLGVVRVLWMRFVGSDATSLNAIAFAASAMVVCLVAGVLIYFYLENPITKFVSRLYRERIGSRSRVAV